MKRSASTILVLLVVLLSSCKKDGPAAGTNTPGGGVTWTISQRAGATGIIFTAQPSVAATVTRVIVRLPAASYADTLQGDGTTVYPANQPQDLDEYNGVAAGQQWTFQFQGRLGSAQGQQYDVTSNYTAR